MLTHYTHTRSWMLTHYTHTGSWMLTHYTHIGSWMLTHSTHTGSWMLTHYTHTGSWMLTFCPHWVLDVNTLYPHQVLDVNTFYPHRCTHTDYTRIRWTAPPGPLLTLVQEANPGKSKLPAVWTLSCRGRITKVYELIPLVSWKGGGGGGRGGARLGHLLSNVHRHLSNLYLSSGSLVWSPAVLLKCYVLNKDQQLASLHGDHIIIRMRRSKMKVTKTNLVPWDFAQVTLEL